MNRLIPPRFHRILDTLPAFNQETLEASRTTRVQTIDLVVAARELRRASEG